MIKQQRQDKAIMYMAETPKEREMLNKIAHKPNIYGHMMKPSGTNEKQRGYSRNRKATRGRKYKFVKKKEYGEIKKSKIESERLGSFYKNNVKF